MLLFSLIKPKTRLATIKGKNKYSKKEGSPIKIPKKNNKKIPVLTPSCAIIVCLFDSSFIY